MQRSQSALVRLYERERAMSDSPVIITTTAARARAILDHVERNGYGWSDDKGDVQLFCRDVEQAQRGTLVDITSIGSPRREWGVIPAGRTGVVPLSPRAFTQDSDPGDEYQVITTREEQARGDDR